jgi:hypothetical protein
VISRQLTIAMNKILRDEARYASDLEKNGDLGRAKLAWAAIDGIKRALKTAACADGESFVNALRNALTERRTEYREDWNDPDGVGTSTFTRVLDLVNENYPLC